MIRRPPSSTLSSSSAASDVYKRQYYGSYYGYGQDGADEAQDELPLDAGSKTDATAAETETAVPEQNTGEKEDAK